MIDTFVVRVHQHGACIADNNHQDMGRSRGAPGYQVWILPGGRRMFVLLGVNGQDLFVDPESKLVMVHTAVCKLAGLNPKSPEAVALWYAVVAQFGRR